MATWQRARGEDQKRERRQAILDAAWELYQTTPFQAITMAQVAEKLGLAKGTLYLYFKTKEELFLSVQEVTLEEWLGELENDLSPFEGTGDIDGVLATIRASLPHRLPVIRLLSILHSVLEQNVEFEAALNFKQALVARMGSLGARIERCLPYLYPGEGARFVLHGQALMVGLFQLQEPTPVARRVLREPGMDLLNVDYLTEVMHSLEVILRGLASRKALPGPLAEA